MCRWRIFVIEEYFCCWISIRSSWKILNPLYYVFASINVNVCRRFLVSVCVLAWLEVCNFLMCACMCRGRMNEISRWCVYIVVPAHPYYKYATNVKISLNSHAFRENKLYFLSRVCICLCVLSLSRPKLILRGWLTFVMFLYRCILIF